MIQDTYALDAIRRDLDQLLEEENIKLGGLTIRTTIDSRIQQAAEAALDKRLRFDGADRRIALREQARLPAAELAEVLGRLERMDARRTAPWVPAPWR